MKGHDLSHYKVLEELRRGGEGMVYRAVAIQPGDLPLLSRRNSLSLLPQ